MGRSISLNMLIILKKKYKQTPEERRNDLMRKVVMGVESRAREYLGRYARIVLEENEAKKGYNLVLHFEYGSLKEIVPGRDWLVHAVVPIFIQDLEEFYRSAIS